MLNAATLVGAANNKRFGFRIRRILSSFIVTIGRICHINVLAMLSPAAEKQEIKKSNYKKIINTGYTNINEKNIYICIKIYIVCLQCVQYIGPLLFVCPLE